jgi:transposase-like protein
MIESELEAALVRPRYGRRPKANVKNGSSPSGISGHRSRSLMGSFGRVEIAVPRGRLNTAEGKTAEWESKGLRKPEFLIVDGGTGLGQALATLWGEVPTQRCTVHKHRNLLAHAPQRLHEEVSADYNDMIYATSAAEIEVRRRAFVRKWRLKSPRPTTHPDVSAQAQRPAKLTVQLHYDSHWSARQ